MRKIIPLDTMYGYDYSLCVINTFRDYWKTYKRFNCIGKPKICDLLFYLNGCKAVYTYNEKKIYAKSGDLVYIPTGVEYVLDLYDFEDENSNTIGINFNLYDKDNTAFIFDNKIKVFDCAEISFSYAVSEIHKYGSGIESFSGMKSGVYNILTKLGEFYNLKKIKSNKYNVISDGIQYLENDEDLSLSIKEIANMCNVSEVYFRRLFTEYAGVSPIKYKLDKKLYKATLLLRYENLPIAEVAERLGFVDPSYFIKVFKNKYNITPLQYRNQIFEFEPNSI